MIKHFLMKCAQASLFALLVLLFVNSFFAQEEGNARKAGNIIYNPQPRKTPPIKSSGILTAVEGAKDVANAYFLDAVVLMNVKADEYIVSFGVAQEALTAQQSEEKVDSLINQFKSNLSALGIQNNDTFIDFITQTRIYEYSSTNRTTVTEKFTGYQTKKNILVRYRDRTLLQPISNAANKASIFDLIKVDYVVTNLNQVKSRLMEEAAGIIKKKEALYGNLLNVKFRPVAVTEERYNAFQPDELYQSYTAYESGNADGYKRVIESRKATTSYYQPLDPNDFDLTINPIGLEPLVQCTLYLRMKYYSTTLPQLVEITPIVTPK